MNAKLAFGLGLGVIVAAVGVTALLNSSAPVASASAPPPEEWYSEPSLPEGAWCVVVIEHSHVDGTNICSPHGEASSTRESTQTGTYARDGVDGTDGRDGGDGYHEDGGEGTKCVIATTALLVDALNVNACDIHVLNGNEVNVLDENEVLSGNEVFSRNGEVKIVKDAIEDSTVIIAPLVPLRDGGAVV